MTSKGEQRKEELLESAKKIFAQKGYYETYVEEIIRDAAIGKGTFYRYFKNKEEIFVALLHRFLDQWEVQVLFDTEEQRQKNLLGYFKILIRRSLTFFMNNEDLCNIYLRVGPGLNTIYEPFLGKFENRMLRYIVNELEAAEKKGILTINLDIELASNMIAGAFLRVDYYYFVLKKNNRKSIDLDRLTDDFYTIIMNGILGSLARA
ncbi:MAG: hypothetical protein CVV44_16510 [Spirochaetae bacterium HGW-Spirochaetae-1]|jgi:AcrR family transcriptional regulator|nr:MAG: hypothetical protein CVV44_16510 [Spirochaetae bacterium HGW-Spirochaetae-1]